MTPVKEAAAQRTKQCRECGVVKVAGEFYANQQPDRPRPYLSAACKPCTSLRATRSRAGRGRDDVNTKARHYVAEHGRRVSPEARRAHRLVHLFGITLEQYNEMLDRQDGVCAICFGEETRTQHGTVRALSVDHDHETGHVRGLLCGACNSLLGFAEDEVPRLQEAIKYLERS